MIDYLPPGDLIFLGTGTSHGVPMIGCECAVCTSPDLRNVRTRSSVILGLPEGNLLIDTPADLHRQFVREKIRFANSILYTHAHSDHLMGLDETRIFSLFLSFYTNNDSIPVYCEARVEKDIRKKFDYIFDPEVQKYPAGGIPKLDMREIRPFEPFSVLGAEVVPLRFHHGRTDILGFRIGNAAYCTDVKSVPPETLPWLYDLDILILGCLRYRFHPTHMSVGEALALVEKIRPKKTFFTHICHDLDHEKFSRELPENVFPAYDGLRLAEFLVCSF